MKISLESVIKAVKRPVGGFLVDNQELKSSSSGLRYRRSKCLEDQNFKLKAVLDVF